MFTLSWTTYQLHVTAIQKNSVEVGDNITYTGIPWFRSYCDTSMSSIQYNTRAPRLLKDIHFVLNGQGSYFWHTGLKEDYDFLHVYSQHCLFVYGFPLTSYLGIYVVCFQYWHGNRNVKNILHERTPRNILLFSVNVGGVEARMWLDCVIVIPRWRDSWYSTCTPRSLSLSLIPPFIHPALFLKLAKSIITFENVNGGIITLFYAAL